MSETTTEAAPITSAAINFPKPHGRHVYSLGDQVVFRERSRVLSGTITGFERFEQGGVFKIAVSVSTAAGSVLISLAKVLFADHPDAVRMLKPVEHLVCGTLVRVSGLRKNYGGIGNGDLAVVLADKGRLVNVALLGGAGDAYGRLSHDALTVVTVDPRTGAVAK
jgi:hypothetical protein